VQGVGQKYGKPTKILDFCNGGIGCDSDSYWMLSLLEKNRTLTAYWQLDYVTVMVAAGTTELNSGYVIFAAEFPGFDAYADAKKVKQNESF